MEEDEDDDEKDKDVDKAAGVGRMINGARGGDHDYSEEQDQEEEVQDEGGYYSNESNMMLRESKYATSASSEPQMHSAGGIQVFKQHHLPSFSRVTEKAEEED